MEELGVTVGFGALSSPAKRSHQASFGHRQMVRLGGNSGPPSLPETSLCFVASQIPAAADNMWSRCSIPGTSVPGLPQHSASFICSVTSAMP